LNAQLVLKDSVPILEKTIFSFLKTLHNTLIIDDKCQEKTRRLLMQDKINLDNLLHKIPKDL